MVAIVFILKDDISLMGVLLKEVFLLYDDDVREGCCCEAVKDGEGVDDFVDSEGIIYIRR